MTTGNGKFIVFEGPDNVGKTTVCKIINEWLNSKGIKSSYVKHPGSTEVGKELRKISKNAKYHIPPITEALINVADNSAFLEQILKPRIDNGEWVLNDRNNFISGLVYQKHSGVSFDDLDRMFDIVQDKDYKIDIVFILTADSKYLDNRKSKKISIEGKEEHDRYEDRGKEYNDNIRNTYYNLMEDKEYRDRISEFVETRRDLEFSRPMLFYINANNKIEEVIDMVKETLESLCFNEVE